MQIRKKSNKAIYSINFIDIKLQIGTLSRIICKTKTIFVSSHLEFLSTSSRAQAIIMRSFKTFTLFLFIALYSNPCFAMDQNIYYLANSLKTFVQQIAISGRLNIFTCLNTSISNHHQNLSHFNNVFSFFF